MIQITNDLLSPDLLQKIKNFEIEVEEFRKVPLDPTGLAKLKEHFRTHHIYHSAGIEGNRLTLHETGLVLKEGIDISGKPIKDSIEVKNLGIAFDFLYELSQQEVPLTENFIRQVHKLIIGEEDSLGPGEYRKIGVIITGSEHKPPEPFEVPIRMKELFDWIKENQGLNPLVIASIAHHEFVKIHPFKDGNGRTARILLNLILLKKGFPICNIRRDERPAYYEALSLADIGKYEPIIEIVTENCIVLFAEYIRFKDESNRIKEWAKRLGSKDNFQKLTKAKADFELWLNKVTQIKLEFKQFISAINENVVSYYFTFYEYPPLTFEKYQQLKEKGIVSGSNFFSIRIHNKDTNFIIETFMFRFFRSPTKYPLTPDVIPIELNFYDIERHDFNFIGFYKYSKEVSLRAFYINNKGEVVARFTDPNNPNPNFESDTTNVNLRETVMNFFTQIFNKVLGV